jgi:hypothetical protein
MVVNLKVSLGVSAATATDSNATTNAKRLKLDLAVMDFSSPLINKLP